MLSQDLDRREHKTVAMNRWQEAAGNLEDARLAFDSIASTINDAIYLDEDAYNQMTPVQRYTETIQVRLLPFHMGVKCNSSALLQS